MPLIIRLQRLCTCSPFLCDWHSKRKIGWWSKYKSIIQHIPLKRSWRFQELTAAAHHCCWLLGFSHWKRIERRRTESSDVNAKRKHVCKLIFVSISSSRLWSHQGSTRAVVRSTPMGVMDEVMTSLVYVKIFEMRKFCICSERSLFCSSISWSSLLT